MNTEPLRRRRRAAVLAAGLALTLAVAGCGSSPTGGGDKSGQSEQTAAEKVYAEIGGMTGQQRRDKLVELAK